MSLYEDAAMVLDDEGITITSYLWPRHRRRIPFAAIDRYQLIELGPLSGRYRLVGLGFRRPRHFFHWDRQRSSTTTAIVLDTGRFIRPVITPQRPEQVIRVLDEHSVTHDERS